MSGDPLPLGHAIFMQSIKQQLYFDVDVGLDKYQRDVGESELTFYILYGLTLMVLLEAIFSYLLADANQNNIEGYLSIIQRYKSGMEGYEVPDVGMCVA